MLSFCSRSFCSFPLSISFLFVHYTHTRAHAVTRSLSSTHSKTCIRTKSLCLFFLHTHTHFSLFLSLSLSLSLSYTHTLIHTHIRTDTLSHLFTRSSTHSLSQCRVCALRCLQRAYTLALSSFCFSHHSTIYTPGSHDFNLKQSCSQCKCILAFSCPWHFLSDGTEEENNRGRDKLMRKDKDLFVPAAKFPYVLSYATDGRRLLPKSRML